MNITDTTNTNHGPGVTLAAWLQGELTAFTINNQPGLALLGPLLASPAVEIVIKDSGATATKTQRVTINTAETGEGAELVESAIFELTNASNHAGFANLETALRTGATSLMDYGAAKADLEAEASWNVAQILGSRQGYVPSAFGAGHVNACASYATLASYRTFFRTQPHNASAPATDVMRLPSQEMYAYNGAVVLAATTGKLNLAFGQIADTRAGIKRIYAEKLKNSLGQQIAPTINTQAPKKAARFYWTLVEALKAAPPGVTPPWPHGGVANWEFTAAMKAVTPDTPDPWQVKIAQWITIRKADMYT